MRRLFSHSSLDPYQQQTWVKYIEYLYLVVFKYFFEYLYLYLYFDTWIIKYFVFVFKYILKVFEIHEILHKYIKTGQVLKQRTVSYKLKLRRTS